MNSKGNNKIKLKTITHAWVLGNPMFITFSEQKIKSEEECPTRQKNNVTNKKTKRTC